MLSNEGQAASTQIMLSPVSAANTAAATSGWIDVRKMAGDIVVVVQAGAITGSIAWTLEDATDGSGTGGAGITPNEGAFAAVTANTVQRRTVNANAHRGWIRCVGTIVTGPVLVAASCHSRPKKTYAD
jgi:hypothetical protein